MFTHKWCKSQIKNCTVPIWKFLREAPYNARQFYPTADYTHDKVSTLCIQYLWQVQWTWYTLLDLTTLRRCALWPMCRMSICQVMFSTTFVSSVPPQFLCVLCVLLLLQAIALIIALIFEKKVNWWLRAWISPFIKMSSQWLYLQVL